jgi:hypothetical protein
MNTKIFAAFVLASVIAPSVFADNAPQYPDQQKITASQTSSVTRAQVRQELAQLQKVGYTRSDEDNTYPSEIQAAEARVAATSNQAASSYGGVQDQSSGSGAPNKAEPKRSFRAERQENDGMQPIYFGS